MKSMLIKHIFMKIKDNYKRFLSLLSMALLGVGFYSGIQACSPDMLKTLDNFYDNNNVYDIEITSNLGMTEENLKDISKINNVEKAIGIYKKYVLKLIALNKEINKVYLEEGKLPKNNNEIAVEKSLLNDNNLKINDNINIENKNYKIVGTIISPLYFSTENNAWLLQALMLYLNHHEKEVTTAKTKQLNIVVTFMGTPYVINDLGFGKTPRFELYNETTKTVEAKADNPRDFDNIVWKENMNVEFSETPESRKSRGRKLTKI